MARTAKEDLSKLPAWARDRIELAERRVDELTKHIGDISDPHPMTNVALEGHSVYPDLTLPAFSEVIFYLGNDRDRWRNTISARISRDDPTTIQLNAADKGLMMFTAGYNTARLGLHDGRTNS